eukprot:6310023-Heterocapsa_arctica.AAC.1
MEGKYRWRSSAIRSTGSSKLDQEGEGRVPRSREGHNTNTRDWRNQSKMETKEGTPSQEEVTLAHSRVNSGKGLVCIQ